MGNLRALSPNEKLCQKYRTLTTLYILGMRMVEVKIKFQHSSCGVVDKQGLGSTEREPLGTGVLSTVWIGGNGNQEACCDQNLQDLKCSGHIILVDLSRALLDAKTLC